MALKEKRTNQEVRIDIYTVLCVKLVGTRSIAQGLSSVFYGDLDKWDGVGVEGGPRQKISTCIQFSSVQFSSVQSLSHVRLFVIP